MTDDRRPRVVPDGLPTPGTFSHLLGLVFVEAHPEGVVVEVDPQPEHCSERGLLHGGFLAALIDTATGLALLATLPEGEAAPHVGLQVQFLSPGVTGTRLRCVARATKSGRRLGATEAEVFQGDRLVARGTGTHLVL